MRGQEVVEKVTILDQKHISLNKSMNSMKKAVIASVSHLNILKNLQKVKSLIHDILS